MIRLQADINNSVEPNQLLHTLLLETVSSNQGENRTVSKKQKVKIFIFKQKGAMAMLLLLEHGYVK